MKRIIILLLCAAAAAVSLAGCKKFETKEANGIYYGNYVYYLTQASFTPGEEGGVNYIEMTFGSKDNFNDPNINYAFYNLLRLYFTGDVSDSWEGEFELAPMWGNGLELGMKSSDPDTGEYISEVDAIEIISGTLTVERLANGSYKVAMQGFSMDGYPIRLVYEGPATINDPE